MFNEVVGNLHTKNKEKYFSEMSVQYVQRTLPFQKITVKGKGNVVPIANIAYHRGWPHVLQPGVRWPFVFVPLFYFAKHT